MIDNSSVLAAKQGCQMVYFQNKDPNLGKFWIVLRWKMLEYFSWAFGLFYGQMIYIMPIW
jgi:hypothetical protein